MIRRIRHTSNQSFMRFSTQQIRSTEILMGDFSFYVSPKQKLLINWKTAQSIANWKHFLFQSTGKKLLDSQIYCAQKIWKFAFTLDNSDALQSAVYSFAISTETVLNRSRKIVWKLHLLFVTSLIQFWPRFIRVSVHSIFVHLSLALKFVSPFFFRFLFFFTLTKHPPLLFWGYWKHTSMNYPDFLITQHTFNLVAQH